MKGKILFAAGLAVGYVLGTRAGRERYEQIAAAASKLWNSPGVQRQVNVVEDYVKDKAPEVVEFVADGAKTVASKVAESRRSARGGSSSARGSSTASSGSASSTAAKPAARKPAAKRTSTRATPKKPS